MKPIREKEKVVRLTGCHILKVYASNSYTDASQITKNVFFGAEESLSLLSPIKNTYRKTVLELLTEEYTLMLYKINKNEQSTLNTEVSFIDWKPPQM